MSRYVLVLALVFSAALAIRPLPTSTAQEAAGKPRKVTKTDAEWKKILTPQQYMVTRHKATEPAFSGRYASSHAKGTYTCVCCGAPLFTSLTKFESGTGWPSFFRPIGPKAVDTAPDFEGGVTRVEVVCNDCGAHLGHVFDDGPPPTGLRYCMNSASLKLVPATATPAKKGASASAKAKKGQPTAPDAGSQDPVDSKAVQAKDKEQEKGKE